MTGAWYGRTMNNTRLRAATTLALIASLGTVGSGQLDAAAKQVVIDSLSAAATPSSSDRELAKSSRHSFRAAIAWLHQQPGRLILRALENSRRTPRPGAFQARRPKAEPFRPWYGRSNQITLTDVVSA